MKQKTMPISIRLTKDELKTVKLGARKFKTSQCSFLRMLILSYKDLINPRGAKNV